MMFSERICNRNYLKINSDNERLPRILRGSLLLFAENYLLEFYWYFNLHESVLRPVDHIFIDNDFI